MSFGFVRNAACAVAGAVVLFSSPAAEADETLELLRSLHQKVQQLESKMQAKDRQIEQLTAKVSQLESASVRPAELPAAAKADPMPANDQAALDAALAGLPPAAPAATSPAAQPTAFPAAAAKLVDVSVDVLFAVGTSSERDEVISELQGGGHDPNRRGLTLQQAELSFIGAIDPYFRGELHGIATIDAEGETVLELEEAFLQTTRLPWDLQLEGGLMFAEFGLINPVHPHAWDWLDQPVMNTRLFGGDGLRQVGMRVSQLLPFDHFSEWHAGVLHARGETTRSFFANDEVYEESPVGGLEFVESDTRALHDFIYLMRWVNGWDFTDDINGQVGVSALFGPNASGPGGETLVYGADFKLKGAGAGPGNVGWIWQTEWAQREFDADPSNPNFVEDELKDWGLYTQLLWWCNRHWAIGMRYELAGGSGLNGDPMNPGMSVSRDSDAFRADRQRLSPLLTFMPSEFTRMRLQYNYDMSDHLDDPVHSVWFGFEFVLGAHPAHGY